MKYLTTIAATLFLLTTLTYNNSTHASDLPVCVYAMSDTDDDGFGWEDRRSCQVTADSKTTGSEQDSGCIDDDNDGWGWNGREICRVAIDNCRDTAPLGNGWGWNGEASCRTTPYLAQFSEIETLRIHTRQLQGESIATATLVCELNGRTETIDFKSNGTANENFRNSLWGYKLFSTWSTGLSDTDGVIWVYSVSANYARYRLQIKLQPSVSIVSTIGNTGPCTWLK